MLHLMTLGVVILLVVDVQNVKPPPEDQKCTRSDNLNLKLDKVCLRDEGNKLGLIQNLENGVVMEKSMCLLEENNEQANTEPVDMDLDSDSQGSHTSAGDEIKKNLSWIRWVEYTTYGKDLIRSNKWNSVQNELITVVTYNVLSQTLLEKHKYLYKYHDTKSLNWETRREILLGEFSDLNADILCLQEVDSSILKSYYNANLNRMGYQGVYKQRTNDKLDGCAIYYKKDKFNLIKYSEIELYKEAVSLLDRDNIGIILKLSLKSNPTQEFIVATTHLLYNPRRGDIKLAQTQLMLAEIEKLAYKNHNFLTHQPEYLPIIFTGDMNYQPENGVYQLVTKSYLEYEGASSEKLIPGFRGHVLNKTLLPPRVGITDSCQYASSLVNREGINEATYSTGSLDHRLHLESVYSHVKGNLPEATTNQNSWVTVDYIFYSQIWNDNFKLRTEGDLKLASRLTLPNSHEAEVYLKHLPNLACGSDHLPLVATFHLSGSR